MTRDNVISLLLRLDCIASHLLLLLLSACKNDQKVNTLSDFHGIQDNLMANYSFDESSWHFTLFEVGLAVKVLGVNVTEAVLVRGSGGQEIHFITLR